VARSKATTDHVAALAALPPPRTRKLPVDVVGPVVVVCVEPATAELCERCHDLLFFLSVALITFTTFLHQVSEVRPRGPL